MIRETPVSALGGVPVVVLAIVLALAGAAAFVLAIGSGSVVLGIIAAVLVTAAAVASAGLFVVNPNEARVIQLFGSYAGTAREPGLWWTNPLAWPRHPISQRVRNFETAKLKVNDHDGNPIEIAAVVVWKVVDTAEAVFQVDDYQQFVHV